jgi:hypothetical protein
MGVAEREADVWKFTEDTVEKLPMPAIICLQYYARFSRRTGCLTSPQSGVQLEMGMPMFEAHKVDTRFNEAYGALLSNLGQAINSTLCQAIDSSSFTRLFDVGGGQGDLAAQWVQEFPHSRAVLFDLPETIERAKQKNTSFAPGSPIGDKVTLHGGDFFKPDSFPTPNGNDVTLWNLKFVLHDWNLEDQFRICLSIRKNVVSDKDRLCVREICYVPKDSASAVYVLHTKVCYGDAKVSTMKDYMDTAVKAGWEFVGVTASEVIQSVLFKPAYDEKPNSIILE